MIDIERIHQFILLGEEKLLESKCSINTLFKNKSLILTKECRSEIISSSNPLISQTEMKLWL